MYKSFLKAVEEVLLDPFQMGFESTNEGLKNICIFFVESVLTDLALKRELEDLLNNNIKKWA